MTSEELHPEQCEDKDKEEEKKKKRHDRGESIHQSYHQVTQGGPVSIYKVVIFVYFFICLIIIKEAFKRFVWNLIWELGRTTGMFLVWFKI